MCALVSCFSCCSSLSISLSLSVILFFCLAFSSHVSLAFFVDIWALEAIRGRHSDFSFLPFKGPDGHFLPVEHMNNCGTPNSLSPPSGREKGNWVVLQWIAILYSTSFPDISTTASAYLANLLRLSQRNTNSFYILGRRMNQNTNTIAKPHLNSPGFLDAVKMCKFFAVFSAVTGGVGMCGGCLFTQLSEVTVVWSGKGRPLLALFCIVYSLSGRMTKEHFITLFLLTSPHHMLKPQQTKPLNCGIFEWNAFFCLAKAEMCLIGHCVWGG